MQKRNSFLIQKNHKYIKHLRFSVFSFLSFFCFILPNIAYEWPQIFQSTGLFHSYFAESRGFVFSNSLIFSEPATIEAVDSGILLAKINSSVSDMGWFESPLGNAVIVTHESEMLTVYANLEEIWLPPKTTIIERGNKIGTSGSSGWQKGQSCLELQVIDTKNKSIINPLILMPHLEKQTKVSLSSFSLMNKKGEIFDLTQRKAIPNGVYSLYCSSNTHIMPYKTTVSINGAETETITYDILRQVKNRLCVNGKKPYPFDSIFPGNNRLLLTEVVLTKGKNTVSVSATNILGEETNALFSIDIY